MILSFLTLFILQVLTPFWWWILVVPFLNGLTLAGSSWRAAGAGMFSAGLLWFLGSLHLYLTHARWIISRISLLAEAPSPYLLIIAATVIAMVCGGFAGSSGYALKVLVKRSD